MLFNLSDLRFIENEKFEMKDFYEFELKYFNEKFEWYFKDIKSENDEQIENRSANIKFERENLLNGKYFDTEQNRYIRINISLKEDEIDWIFTNLRYAFYDKVDYYRQKSFIKNDKDVEKKIDEIGKFRKYIEKRKYIDKGHLKRIEKILANYEIGIRNAMAIREKKYKPRKGDKPYFWPIKVVTYIIIEFLKSNYNLSQLKSAQFINGMGYYLDLVSSKSTLKSNCAALSNYKEIKNIYNGKENLPYEEKIAFRYPKPPLFPDGLVFPHYFPANNI